MEPEKGDCRSRRRTPLLAASLLLAVATLHAQLPAPSGAINDFADLLTTEQEQQLTTLVEEVEDATTAEIAVATVTSLDGMSVEEYAVRLFAQWGIGQADKDNGVLILVAPNDREMRIEVGYGLEGILPDGLAGQIVRETFTPAFRDGDYPRGIIDGATRVADVVRRNQPLTPEQRAELDRANPDAGGIPLDWFLVPFLGLFVAIGSGFGGSGLGARAIAPIFFGLAFGGIPFLLASLMVSSTGLWILVGLGIAALIVGIRIGRRPSNRADLRGAGPGSKSGWVWGSGGGRGSSGWSGGSGSSGSSGSFGGGSSGGGGASGRW